MKAGDKFLVGSNKVDSHGELLYNTLYNSVGGILGLKVRKVDLGMKVARNVHG